MATRCKTGSIPSGLPSFARPRLTGSRAFDDRTFVKRAP
jgi:hypothetical protein